LIFGGDPAEFSLVNYKRTHLTPSLKKVGRPHDSLGLILPGDMHYFRDEADLDNLLSNFHLLSRVKDEGYFENNGIQQFFSNWQVLAQKGG